MEHLKKVGSELTQRKWAVICSTKVIAASVTYKKANDVAQINKNKSGVAVVTNKTAKELTKRGKSKI